MFERSGTLAATYGQTAMFREIEVSEPFSKPALLPMRYALTGRS
jgi:hypothetical protein